MQSSPLPCYLIPRGPKYPPQHLILENPQPTLLPHGERPTFTPIQNDRQDYSSVYPSTFTLTLHPQLHLHPRFTHNFNADMKG
jgi:hypothetical protein